MVEDRPLRADARRNRDQILRAAHTLFLQQGPTVPLDQIAVLAGVGNATLYRHYPTREALMQALVVDNMDQVAGAAADALVAEAEPLEALRRFATVVVEREALAMLPIVAGHVETGRSFMRARVDVLNSVRNLTRAAHGDGSLRTDVEAEDLLLFLAVVTRPLPGVSDELNNTVRDRMLGTLLDGLRSGAVTPLSGAPIEADQLITNLTVEE